jgi:hypothetical protein
MKTKKVTITLTEEVINKGKKDSKKVLGSENLSGYISYLITKVKR